jgi:hypothetical protein
MAPWGRCGVPDRVGRNRGYTGRSSEPGARSCRSSPEPASGGILAVQRWGARHGDAGCRLLDKPATRDPREFGRSEAKTKSPRRAGRGCGNFQGIGASPPAVENGEGKPRLFLGGLLSSRARFRFKKQAVFKILFTLGMGSGLQTVSGELGRLPDGASVEILELMGKRTQ